MQMVIRVNLRAPRYDNGHTLFARKRNARLHMRMMVGATRIYKLAACRIKGRMALRVTELRATLD